MGELSESASAALSHSDAVFTSGIVLSITAALLNAINRTVTRAAMHRGASSPGTTIPGRFTYLRNRTWWLGLVCMLCGEGMNFGAMAIAPAALVAPITGALTVFFSVLLSQYYLGESVSGVRRLGCALSVVGVVMVGSNAPHESGVHTIPQLMDTLYSATSALYISACVGSIWYLVFRVPPTIVRTNVVVLGTTGASISSILVASAKVLSLSASSILTASSAEWLSAVTLAVLSASICILCTLAGIHTITQLLTHFPASLVVSTTFPIYTSAQMLGSAIVFKEWSNTSPVQFVNVGCGFTAAAIAVIMMQLTSEAPTRVTKSNDITAIT